MDFFSIAPLSWSSIFSAILCGGLIGIERQIRGKPIGIRTSALVTIGTYIYMACAMSLDNYIATDPTRIIGQIVTGIGFLGAGVMLSRNGTILGVTSAATIWVMAALGVCIGLGHNLVAIKMALLTVILLYGVDLFEDYSKKITNGVGKRIKGKKSKLKVDDEYLE